MCPAEIPNQSLRFAVSSLLIGRSYHGLEMCSIHQATNVASPLAAKKTSIAA